MSPDWSSVMWLAVVIAAIPAVLWFIKRAPLGMAPTAGGARVVSMLALSASQRVVTVEVGRGEQRQWLVLGVTPQGINTLHTMAPQDDGSGGLPASPAAPALQLLQRLRRPTGGNDAQ